MITRGKTISAVWIKYKDDVDEYKSGTDEYGLILIDDNGWVSVFDKDRRIELLWPPWRIWFAEGFCYD